MDKLRPPAFGRLLIALACVAAACTGSVLPVAAQERTDASLPDETAAARAAPAQAKPAPPPPYGPVLTRRPADRADAANAAAAMRDETESGTPAAAPPANAQPSRPPAQPDRQGPRTARRHSALQPAEPLAPRPLRTAEGTALSPVLIPPPATPPQPVVPSSTITGACPGGVCTDAAGNTLSTGRGAVGVNNGGHVCVRGTATVNCF